MQNRWNDQAASEHSVDKNTGLRVYTSQLLGQDPDLVLHGGGNTSVKGELTDVFGNSEQVLFVKGSGWDLKTIEARGLPPVKLDYLQKLGDLDSLSDSEMMRQLRLALLDPTAPTPSVEAILHALIPHKYVDHSHADAVVTISNTANGSEILRELYGDEVLILPYVMPGFILARQVAAATRTVDWENLRGMVLLHHGIFTFDDDARISYENMIELVSRAEDYLSKTGASDKVAQLEYQSTAKDCLQLSQLRVNASHLLGVPALLRLDCSGPAAGFAGLANCDELITRGPLTPDHTIHTKAFAAVLDDDPATGLQEFVDGYQAYYSRHANQEHSCLDPVPRYSVWRDRGMVYLGTSLKRLQIVQDITGHTLKAIQQAEALGGWQALPRAELFAVEYWELEQAKLKSSQSRAEFEGKITLVTGAASGIGKACVKDLLERGSVVVALDISSDIGELFQTAAVLGLQCDVTNSAAIQAAIEQAVLHFGGLDMLVSNAGNFPTSQSLEALEDDNWNKSLDLNLSSHMRLIRASLPYLKNGIDPSVVIIGSKNVPAPGPGAAAYSAAKAGLTQLARVAALELGESGIRVNTVHPNAVYDTAIWTEDVLEKRARHYGLSVAEYKTANVLKTEVTAADVARVVGLLAGTELSKTTGAQIPIDGGNNRVI
ncbi:MAG: bifunctional aldolase/short-chain dehydrogenase [Gammaproteobacteria bacterium]|jgi:rhamnose utilization protein RhaD (predicted bifunctional aldolase and dehydrogenase)/NAD(P)-dependent dehydrogenase (short-subunit alcohol dehydrogenase family)|nr:bifunctional aldolase/short-chain dehydrogenase [Gammaproteobacteria bacterium]